MQAKKRRSKTERRQALLAAAEELFVQQGYRATTLEALIERSGGSRRDIYVEFGNKEGLFIALMEKYTTQVICIPHVAADPTKSLRETLIDAACALMRTIFSPGALAVYDTISRERTAFPGLAQDFFTRGPGRAHTVFTDILLAAQQRGEIGPIDCALAAECFISMLRGNMHIQAVLQLAPIPDEAHLLQHSMAVVEIFLYGVAARAEALPAR